MALRLLLGQGKRPGFFPSLILVLEIGDLSEEDKEVCSCDPLPHSDQLEPAAAGERGGLRGSTMLPMRLMGSGVVSWISRLH